MWVLLLLSLSLSLSLSLPPCLCLCPCPCLSVCLPPPPLSLSLSLSCSLFPPLFWFRSFCQIFLFLSFLCVPLPYINSSSCFPACMCTRVNSPFIFSLSHPHSPKPSYDDPLPPFPAPSHYYFNTSFTLKQRITNQTNVLALASTATLLFFKIIYNEYINMGA